MTVRAWPIPPQRVLGDRDGLRSRLEYALVRAGVAGVGVLPAALRRTLADAIARTAARMLSRPSGNARRYLAQAFGPQLPVSRREELVRSSWRMLVSSALDGPRTLRRLEREGDLRSYVVHRTPEVERVLASGSGALLVGAHLGALDPCPVGLTRAGFAPLYLVSRPPRNRALSRWSQDLRERAGYRFIPRHGALDLIPRILAGGGFVGMLLDQRARGRCVQAEFFGAPAASERSVGVLARRARVPIVFVACLYRTAPDASERPFEISFPRVVWPDELAGQSPEAVARLVNREFEQLIRAHPEQYLWLHDRFRESGSGGRARRRGAAGPASAAAAGRPKSSPHPPPPPAHLA
jgi:KDO2-lipid IV(A) lauroyltransferase